MYAIRSYYVGVTVDLPWFRKKSVDATLTAALANESAAEASLERVRLEIQFDAPDNELDEVIQDGALQNEYLAFAGEEILSVYDPQLLASGRYRVARGDLIDA